MERGRETGREGRERDREPKTLGSGNSVKEKVERVLREDGTKKLKPSRHSRAGAHRNSQRPRQHTQACAGLHQMRS